VAREFEQAQLTGMLSNLQPDSPYYGLTIRAIYELSSSPKRDEILAQIDEMQKPDPKKQQMAEMMEQIQLEMAKEQLKEQQYENEKTLAEIKLIQAQIMQTVKMTELEDEKVDIQAANTVLGREKIKAQLAKIRSDEKIAATKAKQPKGNSK